MFDHLFPMLGQVSVATIFAAFLVVVMSVVLAELAPRLLASMTDADGRRGSGKRLAAARIVRKRAPHRTSHVFRARLSSFM